MDKPIDDFDPWDWGLASGDEDDRYEPIDDLEQCLSCNLTADLCQCHEAIQPVRDAAYGDLGHC